MERFETVIIGGGQAGLAAGYHLKKRGRPFVILDAGERVGDSWRRRWDSLRLFTPAKYDGLPGLRFPAPRWSFPTKDEMGDYLEAYAERFELPVRTGVYVDRVFRDGDGYVVESGHQSFEADNVIVASGAHRTPKVPAFAAELGPELVQLHSADYRNPAQLREGGALVVGVGNSGAEIAFELAQTHHVWQSGTPSGELPVRHGSFPSRLVLPVIRFLGTHVLTVRTPIGRRVGPKLAAKATPLIRLKSKDLAAAGIERVPRVAGVHDGLPLLEDGRVLDVAERRLVHRLPARALVARPAGLRGRRAAAARARRCSLVARALLRRARLPVRGGLRRAARRRPRRRLCGGAPGAGGPGR